MGSQIGTRRSNGRLTRSDTIGSGTIGTIGTERVQLTGIAFDVDTGGNLIRNCLLKTVHSMFKMLFLIAVIVVNAVLNMFAFCKFLFFATKKKKLFSQKKKKKKKKKS